MNDDIVNNIIKSIKDTIQDTINSEYTEYKNKCLEDLDYKLEAKRNDVVKSVLDGIDVSVISQQPYSLEPVINIKIQHKIYIKEK